MKSPNIEWGEKAKISLDWSLSAALSFWEDFSFGLSVSYTPAKETKVSSPKVEIHYSADGSFYNIYPMLLMERATAQGYNIIEKVYREFIEWDAYERSDPREMARSGGYTGEATGFICREKTCPPAK
jgi:hypothetical protein